VKLTLRQLDIFRSIAQLGSTTRASLALALSQSATSAALQELEGALGIQLFDRVGKRFYLRPSGCLKRRLKLKKVFKRTRRLG
jgi:DNA-binding transcriptional LysR family regulator